MLMYVPKNISTAPKPTGEVKVIADEGERNREAFKLLQSYWEEGADSATIAALFDDLQTEESRLRMLPYYVVSGDAAKYNDAMNNLPDSDTDTYYLKQLYQLYWQVQQSGRTYMQLTAAEEVTVRQIAHSGSRAAFEAHALLYLLYGEEFEVALPLLPDEEAVLLDIAYSKTATAYRAQTLLFAARGYEFGLDLPELSQIVQGLSFQTAFKTDKTAAADWAPNPAQNSTTIAYNLAEASSTLHLYDLTGRTMHTQTLSGQGSYTLDLNGFAPGIYLYTLSGTASMGQYGKLVVTNK